MLGFKLWTSLHGGRDKNLKQRGSLVHYSSTVPGDGGKVLRWKWMERVRYCSTESFPECLVPQRQLEECLSQGNDITKGLEPRKYLSLVHPFTSFYILAYHWAQTLRIGAGILPRLCSPAPAWASQTTLLLHFEPPPAWRAGRWRSSEQGFRHCWKCSANWNGAALPKTSMPRLTKATRPSEALQGLTSC